jgi:hypothetical protein
MFSSINNKCYYEEDKIWIIKHNKNFYQSRQRGKTNSISNIEDYGFIDFAYPSNIAIYERAAAPEFFYNYHNFISLIYRIIRIGYIVA